MDETKKLNEIIEARKTAYQLTPPIILCLLLGVLALGTLPLGAPVFGILAFGIFYIRLVSIARMPCPHCHHPFGSSSLFVLGVGTNSCQNCGVNLNDHTP